MLNVNTNGMGGGRGAQRAVGEQSAAAAGTAADGRVPNPELVERPQRRRFSAEYKLRILQEADACSRPGEIGALLRREGLYTSHLSAWRRQRDEGALRALARPRGRRKPHPLERENAELRHRMERAEAELAKAHKVIEVQGNVCALLGELLGPRGAKPGGSTER
ncbi:hypothetical protein BH23GEM3_BH23GEM3_15160 [soil metagenome]